MTDIEITKTVAEWCGITYKTTEGLIYRQYGGTSCWPLFNPLHDWNDLMTIVMPRLPGNYRVGQWLGGYTVSQNINGTWTVINEGSLADLPRAICELVAEWWEERRLRDDD